MKKLLVGIALIVLFVGCQLPQLNPFVGDWFYAEKGAAGCVFEADMTFSGIIPDFGNQVLRAATGTYAYTADQVDMTISDGIILSALYTFDSPSQMTWSPIGGGVSVKVSRR